MKKLFIPFLLLVAAVGVSAQTSASSKVSDLVVKEKKWKSFTQADPSAADTSNPFAANDNQRDFTRATTQNMDQNRIRASEGMTAAAPPTRASSSADTSPDSTLNSGTTLNYIYLIDVKNTGQKTIRSVTWDYVFFDTAKNQEAGRRHFVSTKEINSGESKRLSERSSIYPTGAIDVSQGAKKFSDRYSEQIIIQKIEYSDGTVWTN